MNNFTGMIFAIIAGIFHLLLMTSSTKIGSLSVYYVSYLTKYSPSLTLFDGVLMTSIGTFCLTLSIALGGMLERKLGSHMYNKLLTMNHRTLVISGLINLGGLSVMYFCSFHISVGYVAMVMIGVGNGIAFLLTMKNACLYNPEKKGMISSIIMSISQIGGPMFTVVGETIINPQSLIIPPNDWKFQPDISKNFFNYLNFIFIVTIVGLVLTLITFIKFEDNKTDDNDKKINAEFPTGLSEKEKKEDSPQLDVNGKQSEKYKKDIRKILHSGRVYLIATVYFLSTFLFSLVMITSKTISSVLRFNTDLIKYSGMVGGIVLCGLGPVWGYLYDKFHFKILITIINCAGIAIGVLLIFSLYNEWFFVIMTIINGIFFVGLLNIFNPHAMKVFTIEYTMEIAGVLAGAGELSNILGSLFAFTISKIFLEANQTYYAYIAIYAVGASLNLISFIVSRFENDDPFVFDETDAGSQAEGGKPLDTIDLGDS